ncbi:MAG: tetratricopeptide repeat protein [Terriglobales bacterium]
MACALAAACWAQVPAAGLDHYYNLEYPEAIADFRAATRAAPGDAGTWNRLAQAELYQEMYRIGALQSTLYGKGDDFLADKPLPPDPAAVAAFEDAEQQAEHWAGEALQRDPDNAQAHYDLAVAYGLQGNFDFSVQKSYWSALSEAKAARREAEAAHKLHPGWVDPLLILGVHNYVAGSLPWSVKIFSKLAGYGGDKDEGLRQVTEVAEHGEHARTDARVLLAVVDRRDGRNQAAAELFAGLERQYPRNVLFAVETGEAWEAAGNHDAARAAFHNILARADQNAPGYAHAPRAQVWYDLGQIAVIYSDWAEALADFQNAANVPQAPAKYRAAAEKAAADARQHLSGN